MNTLARIGISKERVMAAMGTTGKPAVERGMKLPQELRDRIVSMNAKHIPVSEISAQLKLSRGTVYRYLPSLQNSNR